MALIEHLTIKEKQLCTKSSNYEVQIQQVEAKLSIIDKENNALRLTTEHLNSRISQNEKTYNEERERVLQDCSNLSLENDQLKSLVETLGSQQQLALNSSSSAERRVQFLETENQFLMNKNATLIAQKLAADTATTDSQSRLRAAQVEIDLLKLEQKKLARRAQVAEELRANPQCFVPNRQSFAFKRNGQSSMDIDETDSQSRLRAAQVEIGSLKLENKKLARRGQAPEELRANPQRFLSNRQSFAFKRNGQNSMDIDETVPKPPFNQTNPPTSMDIDPPMLSIFKPNNAPSTPFANASSVTPSLNTATAKSTTSRKPGSNEISSGSTDTRWTARAPIWYDTDSDSDKENNHLR
ncbi:hypothetical protein BJ742DRAFT_882626 [Cladochytrium replicatum]|nr:hypothetical protein BJ742DRAFT_882626 [Cladochytrium replicatum]